MTDTASRTNLSKFGLVIGFIALVGGTLVAFNHPATGYELSIYDGTPTAFWFGVSVALATGVVVGVFQTQSRLIRNAALFLSGLSVTAVVLLPLIRGYYHFGGGDSLTHLGWSQDIVAGRIDPINMLYPGIHTMTIFVAEVLGIQLQHAQMIVVVAFTVVFFLFLTLCVRLLGRTGWAVPVGAFSALLLLPNNNVSVHLMAHPITQSLLFSPLIFYLILKYVRRTGEETNRLHIATPTGVLLAVSSIAIILLHPQGALNIVAIFIAIAAVQFFFRRFRDNTAINNHRPVYVPTVISIVAFALWAPRHPRVYGAAESVWMNLLELSEASDEITQRSASLDVLGGSIVDLFAKLFLVSSIFCIVAAGVIAAWYLGYLDRQHTERNALLTYIVISLVPLAGAFIVFFAASVTTQPFRYVGFLMVPITILGAIGISTIATRVNRRLRTTHVQVGLVVAFLLLFPLPMATVHASPTIYQSSADVTKMELDGTATAVEHMDRDVPFVGIRSGPRRAMQGTFGTIGAAQLNVSGDRSAIPEEIFRTNLTTHYDSPRYVPVTEGDYQRETVLYDGFRYPESGFDRLQNGVGVNRVHTNGEYRLFMLSGESGS